MTDFRSFGLAEPIARALAEENHQVPTPIQAQTVPLALAGRDIIGIAQTGTGKTAAFALPILHRLAAEKAAAAAESDPRDQHPRDRGTRTDRKTTARNNDRKTCRALVLSPTRELSSQILDSFQAYGRHLGVTATLAIGGVKMGRQVRALMDGVDVLVATPGRLLDLVAGNALRLNRVSCLVLDEADRMLDMGFIHDIRKIVAKLPRERQTLLFSATMPEAIAGLANEMLRDPARVAVAPASTTAERVMQRIVHVDRRDKSAVLATLLRDDTIDRALVFTRTKHGADKLVRGLGKVGIGAAAIHGNKSQSQRERVLAAFRQGETRILVATDIAARGIDVEGVSHVVNYDLPNEPESYVHRIGRTARAGATGTAISLCDADEVPYLRSIEKLIRMSLPATSQRTAAAGTAAGQTTAQAASVTGTGQPSGRAPGSPRSGGASPKGRHAGDRHAADRDARPEERGNGLNQPALNGRRREAVATGAARPPARPGASRPVASADKTSNGHPGAGRRGRTAAPGRDLSRVAFLNRGIGPRRDSAPHRQSTGVLKHGEGRAD